MWFLMGTCGLGLGGLTHAAPGPAVLAPAPTAACAVGWDQLLTPAQRDAEALVRGCQVSAAKSSKPVLAAQMGLYRHTSSRLLPVGAGARTAQPAMTGKLPPRTAMPSRSPDAQPLRTSSPVGLAPLVDRTAQEHDIDPWLPHAIARGESRHQPAAPQPTMHAKLDAQLRGLGGGNLPRCMADAYIQTGRLVVKKTERPQRNVPLHYAWRQTKTINQGRALQWWLSQLESETTRSALLDEHRSS